MRISKILSVLCALFVGVVSLFAQPNDSDYNDGWNTPTINHATDNFAYVFFGKVDAFDRTSGVDIKTLPPIPGLKYRSCSTFCPEDSYYPSRAVIALRCPEEKILLHWASGRVACFANWCKTGQFEMATDTEVLDVESAADIRNRYIWKVSEEFHRQRRGQYTDQNVPNDQYGYLLTDCWRTDKYCTFYEATWHDMLSCGDPTTESYFSVNIETGEPATITDFVDGKDLPKLAKLLIKHLTNYKGQPWPPGAGERIPSDPLEILNRMDGCALIREGLIIYYHPYTIGCGADGQFYAIIPYSECGWPD